MATPRASTIQQRFGFQDTDLKTSKHDDMMLWLDGNIEPIVKEIVPWRNQWADVVIRKLEARATRVVAETIAWYENNTNLDEQLTGLRSWSGLGVPPVKPEITIRSTWEHPIATETTAKYKNKYVIGFIDLWAHVVSGSLCIPNIGSWMRDYELRSSLKEGNLPEWALDDTPRKNIYFEVKSSIPSVGELIRQVRMYQEYTERIPFYVVCPDDRFKNALLGQGIGFVHYPSGEVFKRQ